MANSKPQNRRVVMLAAIIGLAFVGLLAITLSPVDAEEQSAAESIGHLTQQDAAGEKADGNTYTGTVVPSLAKVVGALILVLICVYGGIFLLKKSMGRKFGGGKSNLLEVVETAHVAPKSSVSLVRVGNRSVLVGVSENNVSMLSEMDETDTADMLASVETKAPQQNFENLFTAAKSQFRKLAAQAGRPALKSE